MGIVYVAGSLNMDVVAFGKRLPLSGETVSGERVGFFPGGKGLNPAVAASRLGAEVRMIGKLGRDAFGDQLYAFAEAEGIDLRHMQRSDDAATGTAIITVSESGENSITVVPGTNGLLSPEDVAQPSYAPDDLLVTVLEIPLPTVRAFLNRGREAGAKTLLSPAPAVPLDFLELPDILVLNETEAAFYLHREAIRTDPADALCAAQDLRARDGQTVVVTLGAKGAVAARAEGSVHVAGEPVRPVDTTGAGDCFVGALASRLVAGDDIQAAIRFANRAAAISVTRPGAAPSMPTRDELLNYAQELI